MSLFRRRSRRAREPRPATPGSWYGTYHHDWDQDHPGQWVRGEAQSGGFRKGNVWVSSTLDWDREWFAAHGMSMPIDSRYGLDPIGPGEVRIGHLDPGEAVVVEYHPDTGDMINLGIVGGRPSGLSEDPR